ncbi:4-hydroxy-tetrahydrodipicolinate reductase [Suttonella sp. R2A3]|uniref:4-hydroxy-tetrahydrodipicolinate reductase n=1 Tax=Suttonella sp. R2A3 TaxID=2908648 RepID=UPI001F34334A|nr:4-hydroxy-tetrahydrodipicolinate reductase [Suttonella sp. R2A3]UJF25008.1 4-hydroxy-tetrahydrodipicolinate reductase [Suttonella sp. R2A3]
MMKVAVHAVDGKMGQAILRLISEQDALTLGSGFVRNGHAWAGESIAKHTGIDVGTVRATSNHDQFCAAGDVVVDFTRPEATLALLSVCRKQRKPLMIGTTGFNHEAKKWIEDAARDIPIILAANTSVGVNVLIEVSRQVAKALPFKNWNVDILDIHHKHKDDAPSGTALRLGEAVAEAQESDFDARMVYPYQQRRGADDIGFAVMRSGEVVGEHTVYFTSDKERIELSHRASDRVIFAQGALQAAAWLVDQPPGLYTMADVLGFN